MPVISEGKFVVVGAAGLLGTHLGEQLLAGGAREVVLVDNLSLGAAENIQPLLEDKRCSFVRADALRLNELFDPLAQADGVFAVAGVLGMPMAANPWVGIDVNCRGLQNILEACRYQAVKKVVFSSSIGVYGQFSSGPEEDSPLRWQVLQPFIKIYAASKVMGEALCEFYKQRYGIDYVALRYSGLYGDPAHRRSLMGSDMYAAYDRLRSGLAPVIQGDGTNVQDYIYAGDAARANVMSMASDVTGESFNIVAGVDTSQNRVIEILAELCGSDLKPEHRIDPSKLELPKAAKIGFTGDKARRLLGWEPQVSVEEGCRRVVAWLDRERAGQLS
ncbi:MAG TPA: NAD-dependent epimerase/dehydratase family protein [Ramlibacter sp.]|nr:NAD-dependent epimerase/dehydratase family protein [Ramlibacter sp.]